MLGAGLKVNISLTLAQFPGSFLEIANLGQNVILYLCTLKYVKVRYLFEGVCETHVILTPGAVEVGLLTALHDTTLAGLAGLAGSA